MKRFEGMLFCTDLDGTLFNDDKTVSKENLDAIEYFKSEGGLFTFITGRTPQTAQGIYELIRPNAPYGCLNGGGIYDGCKKEYLWNTALDNSVLTIIREIDKEFPEIGIQFNTDKTIYFNKDNSAMVRFRDMTGLENIHCHYEEVKEPILKVVLAHLDEKQILELARFLNCHPLADRFDFIRSEFTLYEILPKGVCKGGLMLRIADICGIDRKKTIAVGDYNNDVSMIKRAGLGFAVSNAVKEAKDAARHITVSNNQGAIAAIVKSLDARDHIF